MVKQHTTSQNQRNKHTINPNPEHTLSLKLDQTTRKITNNKSKKKNKKRTNQKQTQKQNYDNSNNQITTHLHHVSNKTTNEVLWKNILHNWENGITLTYPRNIKGKFEWNTSVLKQNGETIFKQSFQTNEQLPHIQKYEEFQKYFKTSQNKQVIAFPNLSKDTILVVPMPILNKNYATLKDFIDNAPQIQQQEFWKKVAEIAKIIMLQKERIWISVHGLGVHYTHVRISSSPKYYFDSELKKA